MSTGTEKADRETFEDRYFVTPDPILTFTMKRNPNKAILSDPDWRAWLGKIGCAPVYLDFSDPKFIMGIYAGSC